ncbi:hypothetical protein [Streptomyces sp. NPDC090022]|uniref:hypothetical protein n=1 Tax=Streptomyces sp. NPDC090022 TaxID=3365920 RepID=UPI00382D098B
MSKDSTAGSGTAGVSDSERLLFGGELAYAIGWERHEGAAVPWLPQVPDTCSHPDR